MDTIKRLHRSRTVIFDKTGTLTEARLDVEDLVTTSAWRDGDDTFWQLISAIEEGFASGHPVARAVFSAGLTRLGRSGEKNSQHTQPCRTVRNVTQDTGLGVSGEVLLTPSQWQSVRLGSHRYLEQTGTEGMPTSAGNSTREGGVLAVYVAVDGKYAATLWLAVRTCCPFYFSFCVPSSSLLCLTSLGCDTRRGIGRDPRPAVERI